MDITMLCDSWKMSLHSDLVLDSLWEEVLAKIRNNIVNEAFINKDAVMQCYKVLVF